MPLRAIYNGNDILSFEYNSNSWNELKLSYKNNSLVMPCCKSKAVPKTSKKGAHFFSHAVKGNCESESESKEHLYIKTIIAKAALKAGWRVYTEWPGETPSKEKWIADVFCIKGKTRIAFEVQLSYQALRETLYRNDRYKKSNVRSAWFVSSKKFKNTYIKQRQDVPFFYLSNIMLEDEPLVDDFDIGLSKFVYGMLKGSLSWEIKGEKESDNPDIYNIYVYPDKCWNCKKHINNAYGWSIDIYDDYIKTIPNASKVLKDISDFVSNEVLKNHGINIIKKVDYANGKKTSYPYVNTCIHCGAIQNNFYFLEKLKKYRMTPEIEEGSIVIIKQDKINTNYAKSTGSWKFKYE